MMIPSNYCINVSCVNGHQWNGDPHYTHWGLIELGQTTGAHAQKRFAEAQARFPESEGFKLELSYVTCFGTKLEKETE